ncbi:MAG TPA: M48 family metalloprotease [Actinomycetales bacterium]|nr:M48 family metalloprotease [Actinomycetales bacterium]
MSRSSDAPTGSDLARTVTLVAVVVALAAVAAVLVPWNVLGAGAPTVNPAPRADFTAQQLANEAAFHRQLRPWTYARLLVAVVVPLVLGLTPLGARLVRATTRWLPGRLRDRAWAVQVVLGTAALTLLTLLLTLPESVAAERVLRRYGLSTQDWSSWSVDALRGWGVSTVVTAVLLLVLVGLARRWRRWWVAGGALAAVAVVAGSFVYPVVVEPLSNTFTPMQAGPQRQDLLDLAARDGVRVDQVLVADASRRTTAENAYVSGLGDTRRVVVYDTLLRGASPREVQLVVAHELGHVKAHDVRLGTTLGALAAVAAVLALSWLLDERGRGRRALLRRAGSSGARDPGVVALVLAVVAVGSLVTAPASTLVSRRIEARADVHSLDLTRDVEGFAQMQRRLAVTNLSDLQPGWWRTALFATHPAPPWRIAMARAWAQQHGLPGPQPVAVMPSPSP